MGHIGLAATTWVPMGTQVPVLSPTDHPNPFKGQRKGLMKNRIFKKLSRGTERPIECENVSPHWQGDIWGGGGGATGATWSWDLGPPPWVRGFVYKTTWVAQKSKTPRRGC